MAGFGSLDELVASREAAARPTPAELRLIELLESAGDELSDEQRTRLEAALLRHLDARRTLVARIDRLIDARIAMASVDQVESAAVPTAPKPAPAPVAPAPVPTPAPAPVPASRAPKAEARIAVVAPPPLPTPTASTSASEMAAAQALLEEKNRELEHKMQEQRALEERLARAQAELAYWRQEEAKLAQQERDRSAAEPPKPAAAPAPSAVAKPRESLAAEPPKPKPEPKLVPAPTPAPAAVSRTVAPTKDSVESAASDLARLELRRDALSKLLLVAENRMRLEDLSPDELEAAMEAFGGRDEFMTMLQGGGGSGGDDDDDDDDAAAPIDEDDDDEEDEDDAGGSGPVSADDAPGIAAPEARVQPEEEDEDADDADEDGGPAGEDRDPVEVLAEIRRLKAQAAELASLRTQLIDAARAGDPEALVLLRSLPSIGNSGEMLARLDSIEQSLVAAIAMQNEPPTPPVAVPASVSLASPAPAPVRASTARVASVEEAGPPAAPSSRPAATGSTGAQRTVAGMERLESHEPDLSTPDPTLERAEDSEDEQDVSVDQLMALIDRERQLRLRQMGVREELAAGKATLWSSNPPSVASTTKPASQPTSAKEAEGGDDDAYYSDDFEPEGSNAPKPTAVVAAGNVAGRSAVGTATAPPAPGPAIAALVGSHKSAAAPSPTSAPLPAVTSRAAESAEPVGDDHEDEAAIVARYQELEVARERLLGLQRMIMGALTDDEGETDDDGDTADPDARRLRRLEKLLSVMSVLQPMLSVAAQESEPSAEGAGISSLSREALTKAIASQLFGDLDIGADLLRNAASAEGATVADAVAPAAAAAQHIRASEPSAPEQREDDESPSERPKTSRRVPHPGPESFADYIVRPATVTPESAASGFVTLEASPAAPDRAAASQATAGADDGEEEEAPEADDEEEVEDEEGDADVEQMIGTASHLATEIVRSLLQRAPASGRVVGSVLGELHRLPAPILEHPDLPKLAALGILSAAARIARDLAPDDEDDEDDADDDDAGNQMRPHSVPSSSSSTNTSSRLRTRGDQEIDSETLFHHSGAAQAASVSRSAVRGDDGDAGAADEEEDENEFDQVGAASGLAAASLVYRARESQQARQKKEPSYAASQEDDVPAEMAAELQDDLVNALVTAAAHPPFYRSDEGLRGESEVRGRGPGAAPADDTEDDESDGYDRDERDFGPGDESSADAAGLAADSFRRTGASARASLASAAESLPRRVNNDSAPVHARASPATSYAHPTTNSIVADDERIDGSSSSAGDADGISAWAAEPERGVATSRTPKEVAAPRPIEMAASSPARVSGGSRASPGTVRSTPQKQSQALALDQERQRSAEKLAPRAAASVDSSGRPSESEVAGADVTREVLEHAIRRGETLALSAIARLVIAPEGSGGRGGDNGSYPLSAMTLSNVARGVATVVGTTIGGQEASTGQTSSAGSSPSLSSSGRRDGMNAFEAAPLSRRLASSLHSTLLPLAGRSADDLLSGGAADLRVALRVGILRAVSAPDLVPRVEEVLARQPPTQSPRPVVDRVTQSPRGTMSSTSTSADAVAASRRRSPDGHGRGTRTTLAEAGHEFEREWARSGEGSAVQRPVSAPVGADVPIAPPERRMGWIQDGGYERDNEGEGEEDADDVDDDDEEERGGMTAASSRASGALRSDEPWGRPTDRASALEAWEADQEDEDESERVAISMRESFHSARRVSSPPTSHAVPERDATDAANFLGASRLLQQLAAASSSPAPRSSPAGRGSLLDRLLAQVQDRLAGYSDE